MAGSSFHSRGSTRHTVTKVKFSNVEHTKSGNIKFETTPYRWVILLTYCGLIINLSMQTVGFSSYVAQIRLVYGIETWATILIIVLPTLLYTPMNFVASWFYRHWMIHNVLRLAAVT